MNYRLEEVDFDPFATSEQDKQQAPRYTLEPVDFDPFAPGQETSFADSVLGGEQGSVARGLAKGGTMLGDFSASAVYDAPGSVLVGMADFADRAHGETDPLSAATRKAGEFLISKGKEAHGYWDASRQAVNDLTPSYRKNKDFIDDPKLLLNPGYMLEESASAATSMLPVFAAALAAPESAVVVGGMIGGAMEGGGSLQQQLQDGVSPPEALGRATLYGMASAKLNEIGLGRILSKPAFDSLAGKALKVLTAGGTEAFTEWLEGPVQTLVEQAGNLPVLKDGSTVSQSAKSGLDAARTPKQPQDMVGALAKSAREEAAVVPGSFLTGSLGHAFSPHGSAEDKQDQSLDLTESMRVQEAHKTMDQGGEVDLLSQDREVAQSADQIRDLVQGVAAEMDAMNSAFAPDQEPGVSTGASEPWAKGGPRMRTKAVELGLDPSGMGTEELLTAIRERLASPVAVPEQALPAVALDVVESVDQSEPRSMDAAGLRAESAVAGSRELPGADVSGGDSAALPVGIAAGGMVEPAAGPATGAGEIGPVADENQPDAPLGAYASEPWRRNLKTARAKAKELGIVTGSKGRDELTVEIWDVLQRQAQEVAHGQAQRQAETETLLSGDGGRQEPLDGSQVETSATQASPVVNVEAPVQDTQGKENAFSLTSDVVKEKMPATAEDSSVVPATGKESLQVGQAPVVKNSLITGNENLQIVKNSLITGSENLQTPTTPETDRTMDQAGEVAAPGQRRSGIVGDKLSAGEVVLTSTGRETTPFPKIGTGSERKVQNTVVRVEKWLLQNALDEAVARGDKFNQRGFEQALKSDSPSQSDKDSAEHYLFDKGFVQDVPAPILKDLNHGETHEQTQPGADQAGGALSGQRGPDGRAGSEREVGTVSQDVHSSGIEEVRAGGESGTHEVDQRSFDQFLSYADNILDALVEDGHLDQEEAYLISVSEKNDSDLRIGNLAYDMAQANDLRDDRLELYRRSIQRIAKAGGIGYDSVARDHGKDGVQWLQSRFGVGFVTKNGTPLDVWAQTLSEEIPEAGIDGDASVLYDLLRDQWQSKKAILAEHQGRIDSIKSQLDAELKALSEQDAYRDGRVGLSESPTQAESDAEKANAPPAGVKGKVAASSQQGGKISEKPVDDASKGDAGVVSMALRKDGEAPAQGMKARTVQGIARAVAKEWNNGPEIFVVQGVADLPAPQLRAVRKSEAEGNVQALYSGGKVYLVADRMVDPNHIYYTLLHEVVGHHGLRVLMSKSERNRALDLAWMNAKVQNAALKISEEYGLDLGKVDDRREAVEEVLANMAENGVENRALDRFVAVLRRAIRRIFGGLRLSDAEIRELVSRARQAVTEGIGARGDVGSDARMQRGFHGSPVRDIEKNGGFKLEYRGTGEGRRPFDSNRSDFKDMIAWGHYVAGEKAVAERYRRILSDPREVIYFPGGEGEFVYTNNGWLEKDRGYPLEGPDLIAADALLGDVDIRGLINSARRDGSEEVVVNYIAHSLQDAESALAMIDGGAVRLRTDHGQLYELEIPEDPELLDWEKTLLEQPEQVRSGIENLWSYIAEDWKADALDYLNADFNELTGKDIYKLLGKAASDDAIPLNSGTPAELAVEQGNLQRAASEILLEENIKGVKYLDGNSRRSGEGTYNYVIFSDPDVEIVKVHYKRGSRPSSSPSENNLFAVRKAREVLSDMTTRADSFGRFKAFNTQFHKALRNKQFGRIWERIHQMSLDSKTAANRPASLVPEILVSSGGVGQSFRVLAGMGKHASAQDLQAVSEALSLGTLSGPDASPFSGRVFTDEELLQGVKVGEKTVRLTPWQVELYRKSRAAVDASLDEVAAATGWKIAQTVVGDSETLRGAVMDNPDRAGDIVDAVLQVVEDRADASLKEALGSAPSVDEMRVAAARFRTLAATVGNAGAIAAAKARRSERKTGVASVADKVAEAEKAISANARKELDSLRKKHPDVSEFSGRMKDAVAAEKRLRDVVDARKKSADIFGEAARLKKAGYMTLMRFGKYRVAMEMPGENGQQEIAVVYRFESQSEANRMRRDLLRKARGMDGATVTPVTVERETIDARGVSPETALLFAEKSGMDQDEAMQAWYREASGQRSALKRLLHRQGYAGYSDDLPRVLSSFILSNASRAATSYHDLAIGRMIADKNIAGDVADEARRLMDYINEPGEAGAAVRSVIAYSELLGVAASGVVNATQPIMMTLPRLTREFGALKATKLLLRAFDMYARSGGDKEFEAARDRARKNGVIDANEVHHLYEISANKLLSRVADPRTAHRARAALSLWAAPFAMAETMNREVSFAAAYVGARESGMKDPEAYARQVVIETQGMYEKHNRPNAFRGAVPGSVFMFKQYSVAYMEMVSRLWKSGGAGKKAALLALALMWGASGWDELPFVGNALDFFDIVAQMLGYNTLSRLAAKKGVEKLTVATAQTLVGDELGKQYGKIVAEAVNDGLPYAVLGVDMGGSMGMGRPVPGIAAFKPSEPDKAGALFQTMGPAGGIARKVVDGFADLSRGDVGRALATISPRGIRSALRGLEMVVSGEMRDAAGRRIGEADLKDAIAQGLGFQPSDRSEATQEARAIRELTNFYTEKRATLVDEWASVIRKSMRLRGQELAAKESGDMREARKLEQERIALEKDRAGIIAEVDSWQEKNPGYPMPKAALAKSAQAKAKNLSRGPGVSAIRNAPRAIRKGLREDVEE